MHGTIDIIFIDIPQIEKQLKILGARRVAGSKIHTEGP